MCCRCVSSVDGRAQIADFEDVALLVDLSTCKYPVSMSEVVDG